MKRRKKRLLHFPVAPLICLGGLGIACFAVIEFVFTFIEIQKESFEAGQTGIIQKIGIGRSLQRFKKSTDSTKMIPLNLKKAMVTTEIRRKIYPKRTNDTHYQTMQNPYGGAFVHIGKTGGSTLSVLLRNGCHSFMPHPCRDNIMHESVVSKLVASYYHVPDFATLKQSNHTFYLITCRDPYDRTISAFVYDHILNKYARNETISPIKKAKFEEAYKCFPTIQRFVELLGDQPSQFHYPHKQNWVSAASCADLAKAAFHSRVKIYNHLFFSMRLLLAFIPNVEKQSLLAIRQENLWDDWTVVNKLLGQVDPVYIPTEETNLIRNVTAMEVANQMPVTRDLNDVGVKLLCNALLEEYQAYFFLLKRAMNLSPSDLHLSMEHAKKNCPDLDMRRIADSA